MPLMVSSHQFKRLTFRCSFIGIASHNSSHPVDSTQTPPANQVKPESVQSNGPSHPVVEAPPPIPDSNSNGCSQPSAPSHDRNGSLEPPLDHRDTATAHERPAKRCRTEAEPLGQSEVEPSRTQENWRTQSSVMLTNRRWIGVTDVVPASPLTGRGNEEDMPLLVQYLLRANFLIKSKVTESHTLKNTANQTAAGPPGGAPRPSQPIHVLTACKAHPKVPQLHRVLQNNFDPSSISGDWLTKFLPRISFFFSICTQRKEITREYFFTQEIFIFFNRRKTMMGNCCSSHLNVWQKQGTCFKWLRA